MAGFPRNFGRLAPSAIAAAEAKVGASAPVVETPIELRVEDIVDLPGQQQPLGPAPIVCDRIGVEPQTDDDEAAVRTSRLQPMERAVPTFMGDLPGSKPAPVNKSPLPVRRSDPVAEKLEADRKAQMIADCAALEIPAEYRLRSREQQQTLLVLQGDRARAALASRLRAPLQRQHYRPSGPRPSKMPAPAPMPAEPKTAPTQPGGGFRDRRSTAATVSSAQDGLPQPASPENERQPCVNPDDIPW